MSRRAGLTTSVLFAVVAAAPFLPALFANVPGLRGAGALLDAWFRFQCERDPARTFAGAGVCARCLGIYAGFGLGGVLGRPELPLRATQAWIAVALLLLAVDLATEALGLRPPSAALRVLTGALLAYPVALLVRAALLPARRGA